MIATATEITDVPTYWPVASMAEYHSDRKCDSSSTLKTFVDDTEKYYLERIKRSAVPKRAGPELDFGNAFHCYLQDPDRFESDVVILPAGVTLKQNAGKQVLKDYPHSYVIESDGVLTLEGMAAAVRRNRAIGELVPHWVDTFDDIEHAVRWRHQPSGTALKVCFDRLLPNGMIVDIKTAANPELELGYHPFKCALWEYGYYRQAALYCAARDMYRPFQPVELPDGSLDTGYRWVVVGKTWPYKAYIYRLDAATLELGKLHNELILESLAGRREFSSGTDDDSVWRSPNANRCVVAGLDDWAFRKVLDL